LAVTGLSLGIFDRIDPRGYRKLPMTGIGWAVLFFIVLATAAATGSGVARRMLGIIACVVGLLAFVLWLFAPA
jgi:hypothetical protein